METNNIKILAIDDNLENLMIIKSLILKEFPKALFLTAPNGKKGLEIATAQYPDVILMDILMPDMDGFEVCEFLNADPILVDIPVAIVTNVKGTNEIRIRAMEVGATAYLEKPVDMKELAMQIRAMLKIKIANVARRTENERLEVLVEERTRELLETHKATLHLLEELKNENEARRNSEEALRLNEEKYRFMTENSSDVIWHLDSNYCCDYISPADERMRGFSKEEMLGKSILSILKPEGYEQVKQVTAQRLKDEKNGIFSNTYQYEFEQICKDGSWIWIETNSTAHFNEAGEHVGFHGVTRNISERKAAQAAIRESEEKYRIITEQSPIAIELYNSDGKLANANKACLELFGIINPENIKGFSLFDDPNISEFHKNELKQGRSINYQDEFDFDKVKELNLYKTSKSGKIYLDTIITPITKEGKNETEYLVQIQDITERIQVESQLKKLSNHYQKIIENAPDGIVLINTNGEFKYISTSAKRMLGYDITEEINSTPYDLTHPDDLPNVLFTIDKLLHDFTLCPLLQYRFLNKVGVWIWIESKFTVQIDDSNEVFIIINFRDITEQRKADEELSQTRLNYETFFNTIDDFLFVLDVQGNIIHTNNTVNNRLLYSKEELLGKSVLEVNPADRREEAGKIVGEMLSGLAETCPVPIVTKSGVQIPVETRVTHGFWNGEPVIFGVTKDVSKVKLSEEKFSKVFHVNPSACTLSEMDNYKYVEVNEAFYKLFGFDKDEVIGKSAIELGIISPESYHKNINSGDAFGNVYNIESIGKTKTGDEKQVLISSENINVQDKSYRFTLIQDITDRKLAEESLREREGKYRFMFANNPQPMFIYDLETLAFLEVNQSAINHYGYSREEFLAMSIKDIRPEEDLPAFLEDVEKAKLTFISTSNDWKHIKKNGELIYVQVTALSIISNGRNARHIMVNDITDRKNAEKELRESESKYFNLYSLIRSMSDTMPDMLWAKDLNNNYIFTNKAFSKIILNATDTSEAIGKNDIFFALRERETHIENPEWHTFGDICANTDVLTLQEMKPMRFDEYGNVKGKFIYLDVDKAPLYNSNNELIGVVGSGRDVTQKKEVEKNLRHLARLYALLSEINRAIVKHKNQDELFDTICKVAIEFGQFRMAWFGKYDEDICKIIPIISAGYSDGYLDLLRLDPNSKTNGKGPTGRAFHEGEIVFCNDIANDPMMQPWKDQALKRGYQSSFAAPILRGGKPYGTFTLYASEVGFFNNDEQKLLAEIGQNISYAIDAIDSELERIQIQQDLEISELKYRELMENSPEGITIYVDGKVAYINKEAMRLMRAKDKNNLLGKTIVDFIHPDNQALVLERMQYVAMAPLYAILPSVEEKYIRLDGTEVYVEIKVMPILYDGKPAIQLSGHDISDRKNAEMALADTMTELKTIYDNSPVMMCVVDEKADIQFANQAFAHLSETIKSELKGEQVGDVMGCVQALENNAGCGFGKLCGNCGLRGAMLNTLKTGKGHNNIEHKSTLVRDGIHVDVFLLASTALILTGKTKRLLLCLVDITNRKQAEEALQKSEEKYRLLAENMHDGILSFGADNKINYVSASYIKQLGYSEKTQLDKGVTDIFSIIHPEDRDEVFANIFDAIEKKKPQLVYSYRVKHFLGHYIWREDSTKFNYDDDGNYAGAYLVCRDITIRKQTQEALQLSEIHLNNLFEFSPISIWEEDFSEIKNYFDELKGQGIADFREFLTSNPHEVEKLAMLIKVAKVNETSVKIFGADTKEELISSLPFAFSHINVPVFLEEFVALAEGKIHFEGETQIDTLKGEKRNFWLNLTVMPDYEDTLSKVLVTFIDITERKQAEDALQKSEMFLRTFIDNTPFEIWARDVNNIGILENKKVVDHYGSILGKQPNELSIQDRKLGKTWESQNVRVFKGEMIDEVVEFKENKELLFYQKISFPIINKSEIIGIAGFNIDITERKRADEALRISQVQLKQFAAHLQDVREEEKKILAREIHDELGQILVALKIDLGLLKQKVVRKFEDTDPGDLITKFDHLYVLVDDTIKTTRKIMTNLRPEVLDLLGFMDAVKLYSRDFKERHRMECNFTCNITKLEIQPQHSMALFRIVQESLTNVAKHAKASTVSITLEFLNDKLVLKIIDNGVGFDENHKGRSDSYGMIGMKERVFLLDGELSIVGKLGIGTTVKVSMPYKEA